MRIVAGTLGGRRLNAPHGTDTRPTTDRVREALFSILGDIDGARVLDLYAGTGSLGLEALSRGASRVLFVESAKDALTVLRRNIDDLAQRAHTEVLPRPVERAAAEIARRGPFDLVLVDPPYVAWRDATRSAGTALAALVTSAMSPGVLVVAEHATRDTPPEIEGLVMRDQRTYGDTSLLFLERAITTVTMGSTDDSERG